MTNCRIVHVSCSELVPSNMIGYWPYNRELNEFNENVIKKFEFQSHESTVRTVFILTAEIKRFIGMLV